MQNEVEAALWEKLRSDATLGALLSGTAAVYSETAPQGAAKPYVVFSLAAGTHRYTFTGRAWREPIYTIKAVTEGVSGKVAGQIDDRIDTLLTDGTLTITGGTLMSCRRESDVSYPEDVNGKQYRHRGGTYRLFVQ